jgi:hypothetical protein
MLVKLSVAECYLIYQTRPNEQKNNLLRLIGTARNGLREAGPARAFYNLEFTSQAEHEMRVQSINNLAITNSQEFQEISSFPINIDHDVFFEMVINNVKNDLLTYQIF